MTTFLILANLIFSQTALTLSPPLIELKMPAGAKRKFEFTLINQSKTAKIPLALYPADIIQTREGSYDVVATGKGILSCAPWIELKDTLIFLAPDSGKEITGYVKIPIGVKGGRYGAVAVETRLPKEVRQPKTRALVILLITVTPEIKPSKVTITDLKFEEPTKVPRLQGRKFNDSLAVIASVKNGGDILIKNKGNFIIRDKNGRRIREYPLGGEGKILPNTEVDVISVIPKPPPGEYIAEAIIKYGSSSPAVVKVPFKIAGKKVEAKGPITASIPMAISINPENVQLPIFPNAVRTSILMLENDEAKEIRVSAQMKELLYDETGEMVISDTSLKEWSSAKWIETEPKEFSIKPYEKKPIRLTIKVPADSSGGGRYACVKFNVHGSASDTAMPSPFYVPVILTFTKPIIRAVKVEEIALTGLMPARVDALVKNIGNIHLKPIGKVTIYSKTKTKEIAGTTFMGSEQPITEFSFKEVSNYVLPDGIIILEGEAAGKIRLPKGDYKIKVEIDLGKGETVTSEKEIKI
jgi:hypothetical protein